MTDQTDKARRRLPYIIGEMDIAEIAHYCDATGLSQDPAINALLNRLCDYEAEEMKRLTLDNSKRFLDWADGAKAQLEPKAPPGRKSEYLPLILKLLKFGGPLKRSELVLKVLRAPRCRQGRHLPRHRPRHARAPTDQSAQRFARSEVEILYLKNQIENFPGAKPLWGKAFFTAATRPRKTGANRPL